MDKLVIQAMSTGDIDKITKLEEEVLKRPQLPIETQHVLHGGMYHRTIMIPAGALITGALIKVATTLVVSGDTTVFIGGDTKRLTGYHVIPAKSGRKQAFLANSDTYLTMSFCTSAQTVDEAEQEFTDEYKSLSSRKDNFKSITYVGD